MGSLVSNSHCHRVDSSHPNITPGEMESTMLRHLCQTGNLLAALDAKELQPHREMMKHAFPSIRRTVPRDDDKAPPEDIEEKRAQTIHDVPKKYKPLLGLLPLHSRATAYGTHVEELNGLKFTAFSYSPADSHISLNDGRFGRIADFICYNTGPQLERAIVFEPFAPLRQDHVHLDPYRPWRKIAGCVLYASLGEPVLVNPSQVVCHTTCRPFRVTATRTPLVYVAPLNKVRVRIALSCSTELTPVQNLLNL